MRKKRRVSVTAAAVLFLVAAMATYAQPPQQGGPPGPGRFQQRFLNRNWDECEVRELVETVMMARLSRELGLTDEQTIIMMRRLDEYKERVAGLKRERNEKAEALKTALDEDADAQEIERILTELVEQDENIATARLRMFRQGTEGLTIKQRAKLYIFMSEFDEEIRKLIHKARTRARGGPFHQMQGGGATSPQQPGRPPAGFGPGEPDAPQRPMPPNGELRPPNRGPIQRPRAGDGNRSPQRPWRDQPPRHRTQQPDDQTETP